MKRNRKLGILTILIVGAVAAKGLVFADTTKADPWPSFRGPNGSGIGSGKAPEKWNVETGENIAWKVRVPGLGLSSPIVWGDRVYLTTAVSAKADDRLETGWMQGSPDPVVESGEWPWQWKVLCLDRKDGRQVWEQTAFQGVPKFKRHPKSSHANSTPATDGKHLVAFFGTEGLFCYDTEGKLLWKQDLGDLNAAPEGYPEMQWGFASSPIIHDGQVIVQCDAYGVSFWAAFDIETGKEIRRVERGDAATWCTPSIHVGKQRTQLICNGWKKMAGYDLNTGAELWWLKGQGDVPVPRPIISEDLFFLTTGHGGKPIYAIRPDATGDLTPTDDKKPDGVAWWHPKKGSYMPTPILVNDTFFIADDGGIITAYDPKNGEKFFRERTPASGHSTYSASVVSDGNHLFLTSEDGQIDVIKAGRTFEVVASNQMGETCMATPAIADGRLYIRGKNHLFCIGK